MLFKSGFIGIIGKPNAGKSTLMNFMVGEKVAITTRKPQTTRNRIMGIKNTEVGQFIFLDTPGIHKAKTPLNRQMVSAAMSVFSDVNMLLLLVDAGTPIGEDDNFIVELLKKTKLPVVLVINKIDLIDKEKLLLLIDNIKNIYTFKEIVPICALKGFNVDRLLDIIWNILPEGPQYFPGDMITDRSERFLAAEIIREKITILTHKEVPYSTAVIVESFKENEAKGLIHIQAAINVEKDSQKGIIIGKRGGMLKKIGTAARLEMEKFFSTRIYLELFVKVQKDWSQNPRMLGEFGYPNE
ncbi:MAG: GTPase Era [Candidatus Celaenobacter antarcticus]|nr:GTPase Era [Candidatus Celaenobacter antarcticus]